VVTIEGIGTRQVLDPLQDAFMENDAVQCGFCTPGMILAAKSLLKRNPSPTREEIGKALGSNLCRCTGYVSILDAVTCVVTGKSNGHGGAMSAGQRADALDKVLGEALYAADLTMPGMVHASVVRSPHPHAEIISLDDSEARALPGVLTVVTAKDVPGLNRFGRALKDQPVLADDRVRQIGDAVAAVAAISPEIAAEAASLVRVEYNLLTPVLRPEDALGDDALAIHGDTNLLSDKEISWGDVEAGMAQADIVIDETYTTPWCEHAYLEPEATLAYFEKDQLVLRTATQHSFLHQSTVAETMDMPLDKVRIVPTVIGGAFGGKTDLSCQCIAALLAIKTEKPVKIVYTREESFNSTTKRHPFRIRCRTGVTRDGRLTALEAEMLADTGAYASAAPGLFTRAGASLPGPYHFPSARIRGKAVYTNNTLAGAMRGFGAPQAAFAIEAQMDAMAAMLGIDPLEFRYMNRRGLDGSDALPQELEQEASYESTVDAIRPHYEEAKRGRRSGSGDRGNLRRGIGLASMRYGIGSTGALAAPGRVTLEVQPDGHIHLLTGAVDLGQGTGTVLTLIVADELALSPDLVSAVSGGDTDKTPDAGSSTGSRLVYYVGNAAVDSAARLREAFLSTASELLERPADGLELKDGRVVPRDGAGGTALSVSLAEVAQARAQASLTVRFEGQFEPGPPMTDSRTGLVNPYAVYVAGTHMAEVEVDIERGSVRVLRVVAAHDVGRTIHPAGLKGQIEGAVAMGLGLALKEEYLPGETIGFKQYRIPTARDTPEVVMVVVENKDPSASLGAKGVAECATVAVAPAIANAIADAIGVPVRDLPATPARIKDLLNDRPDES
jgi:CO/xanthine dehydrogenase Mo-binding subunit